MYFSEKGNSILDAINTGNIKRIVPLEEVSDTEYFWDLAEIAVIFNHEIVEMEGGVWRWKINRLANLFHQYVPVYSPSAAEAHADGEYPAISTSKYNRASIDLNKLRIDLQHGLFSVEEWMKFYMQMGYSLGGYCEVFGAHEAAEFNLEGAKKPTGGDEYTETVLDYMRRIHEGKVLKL